MVRALLGDPQVGIGGVVHRQRNAAGLAVCGVTDGEIGFRQVCPRFLSNLCVRYLAGLGDGKGQRGGNGVVALGRFGFLQTVGAGGEVLVLEPLVVFVRRPLDCCPFRAFQLAQLQLDAGKRFACCLIPLGDGQGNLLVLDYQRGCVPSRQSEHGVFAGDGHGAVLVHKERDPAVSLVVRKPVAGIGTQASLRQDVGMVLLYQPPGNADLSVCIRC